MAHNARDALARLNRPARSSYRHQRLNQAARAADATRAHASDPGDHAVSSGAKQPSNEQTESLQISNSFGGVRSSQEIAPNRRTRLTNSSGENYFFDASATSAASRILPNE